MKTTKLLIRRRDSNSNNNTFIEKKGDTEAIHMNKKLLIGSLIGLLILSYLR